MKIKEEDSLSAKIAEKASDKNLADLLLDQPSAEKHLWLMRALAMLVWIATLFLALRSNIPSEVLAGRSAQGEILFISLTGLCLVLFSNTAIANFTGFRPFFSGWVPINKKSPVPLLRLLGWILLLIAAGAFFLI